MGFSISSFGNTVARAAPINVVQLTWSVLSKSMLNLRMGKTLQTLSAVRKNSLEDSCKHCLRCEIKPPENSPEVEIQ